MTVPSNVAGIPLVTVTVATTVVDGAAVVLVATVVEVAIVVVVAATVVVGATVVEDEVVEVVAGGTEVDGPPSIVIVPVL